MVEVARRGDPDAEVLVLQLAQADARVVTEKDTSERGELSFARQVEHAAQPEGNGEAPAPRYPVF